MEKGLVAVGLFDNVCRSDTTPCPTDPVIFGQVFLGEGQIITEGPR